MVCPRCVSLAANTIFFSAGEMADADYGYVGAGRDKISLYKGKVCVEKNIPEEEAVERLLEFIRTDREENQQ